jgi:hypothetical protein
MMRRARHCPPFTSHGASIRQPLGACWQASALVRCHFFGGTIYSWALAATPRALPPLLSLLQKSDRTALQCVAACCCGCLALEPFEKPF